MPAAYVKRAQVIPAADDDGEFVQARGLKYGELAVQMFQPALASEADDGSYVASTNTLTSGPSDGLVWGVNTVFSAQHALVILGNFSDAAADVNVLLDSIFIKLTTLGTGMTSTHLAVAVDNIGSRWPTITDGVVLTSGSPNSALGGLPIRQAGGPNTRGMSRGEPLFTSATSALIGAASANVRYLYRAAVHNVAPTVGETWHLDFAGKLDRYPQSRHVQFGPVVIGPRQLFLLHWWSNESTGATSSLDVRWWER